MDSQTTLDSKGREWRPRAGKMNEPCSKNAIFDYLSIHHMLTHFPAQRSDVNERKEMQRMRHSTGPRLFHLCESLVGRRSDCTVKGGSAIVMMPFQVDSHTELGLLQTPFSTLLMIILVRGSCLVDAFVTFISMLLSLLFMISTKHGIFLIVQCLLSCQERAAWAHSLPY